MDVKNTQLICNFDKDTYQTLNSQFAKVRIRIAYDGENRNRSIIPREVLEKMSKTSLLNIPIVGEWSEEKQNFLGHGGKIELDVDNGGIKFIDTTRPYGVIPSDSEIYWEKVKDKKGFEEKEYLCCTGILWYGRYPETEKILDDGANQSMEISINDAEYTEESRLLIKDAEFSALCILGRDDYHSKNHPENTNVEPCFEDAVINKYSLSSQFKKEFQLMMDEYTKFNLEDDSNLNINNNSEKEEKVLAENKQFNVQLDQEKVKAKLVSTISENTYRNKSDKHCNKYTILSSTDSIVNVIDREDGYKIYSVPYMTTITENEIVTTVNYEKKEEKSFVIGDKLESELFSIQNEVEVASMDFSAYSVSKYHSETLDNLNLEKDALTENFNNALAEIKRLTEQLEIFEKEKKEFIANKHKERVDDLLSNYERVVPKCTELSQYAMNIDYKKSYETIEDEVIKIYADYKFKTESNGKKTYQAIEAEVANSTWLKSKSSNNRYGTYFDE